MSEPGITATLATKLELHDLVNRLARAMDRNDSKGVLACYHPGAIDHHGGYDGPVEGFVDFINALHTQYFDAMFHHNGNHVIEVSGDDAFGELYCNAYARSKGEAPYDHIACGRYLDHYQRRDGEWRILERTVVMEIERFSAVPTPPEGILPLPRGNASATTSDPSYAHLNRAATTSG